MLGEKKFSVKNIPIKTARKKRAKNAGEKLQNNSKTTWRIFIQNFSGVF
jgi:hypothetical protein